MISNAYQEILEGSLTGVAEAAPASRSVRAPSTPQMWIKPNGTFVPSPAPSMLSAILRQPRTFGLTAEVAKDDVYPEDEEYIVGRMGLWRLGYIWFQRSASQFLIMGTPTAIRKQRARLQQLAQKQSTATGNANIEVRSLRPNGMDLTTRMFRGPDEFAQQYK